MQAGEITMIKKIVTASVLVCCSIAGTAQAALEGRDLNGSIDSFEAYYDTVLNITWLDVNSGAMGQQAEFWALNLSIVDVVNNITYDGWRLPTVTGVSRCKMSYNGTDCGWNVNTDHSELAHLFHVELGNKAYYNTSAVGPQDGWGLRNAGPFTNLSPNTYWSTSDIGLMNFSFSSGYQNRTNQDFYFHALAVSDGDVGIPAAIPEASTYAMFLAGLGLVGFMAQRRKHTRIQHQQKRGIE